jgi:hypothetical protein
MMGHFLPFGKYRNQPPESVPTDYLWWFFNNCKLSTGLRWAVRAELASRPDCPHLTPESEPVSPRCQRCGNDELSVIWHEQRGGVRLPRADCPRCGRFVTFLPLLPENVARADAARPPAALLDVLLQAEAEGVELVRCGDVVLDLPSGRASAGLRALLRQTQHQLLRHLPHNKLEVGT